METNNQVIYNADFYLRLSREDGDKAESDSITNQRALLMDFLSSHPDIHLHKVRVDDGYSGVNFERPDFMAMMESIKKKEINCIIVKDFSRLGRNFIETGKYIEKVFPFMGIRFISINDNYDSIQPRTSSDSLLVPVKNLMNDAYCRDISIKIRSQLDIKRKMGECIAPFAVYGYEKDPLDKNNLIIDEIAAGTIQDIFKKKLEGYSAQTIADWLNGMGVLSPMEYKRYKGSSFSSPFKRNAKAKWTAVAIYRILKNPVYTGTLVQGKRSTPNYKIKRQVEVPRERWITIENAHEPVISREMFGNVARILGADTRTSPTEEMVFQLAGLVYCGDCGRSMVRKNNAGSNKPYFYYICSGYKQKCGCTSHSIRDKILEEAVLNTLQEHIKSILDMEDMLQAIEGLPYTARAVRLAEVRLHEKREEIERYHRYKLKLHEDYVDKIITREDYISFGKRYDEKAGDAEEAAFKLEQEVERLAGGNTDGQQWITYFKEHKNIKELDRKITVELVDNINVYEGQRIHIRFKFHDEYEHLCSILKMGNSRLAQASSKEVG